MQNTIVRMQAVSKELGVSVLFDKQRGILSILKITRESLSPEAKQLMLDFFVVLIRRQFVTTASANEMQTAVFELISLDEASLLGALKVGGRVSQSRGDI
ncbi:hypothetical protein HDU77_005491 [Chytriomyces hyalinus]|nr:hypothetical protein HDU77_005491 [Chytriomyces hyalinus]